MFTFHSACISILSCEYIYGLSAAWMMPGVVLLVTGHSEQSAPFSQLAVRGHLGQQASSSRLLFLCWLLSTSAFTKGTSEDTEGN